MHFFPPWGCFARSKEARIDYKRRKPVAFPGTNGGFRKLKYCDLNFAFLSLGHRWCHQFRFFFYMYFFYFFLFCSVASFFFLMKFSLAYSFCFCREGRRVRVAVTSLFAMFVFACRLLRSFVCVEVSVHFFFSISLSFPVLGMQCWNLVCWLAVREAATGATQLGNPQILVANSVELWKDRCLATATVEKFRQTCTRSST